MKLAYVDTSCLVAIAFAERGHRALARRLTGRDRLFASNLLEAELRAAFRREDVPDEDLPYLSWITWVHPHRPLTPEYRRVLDRGYLRSADLWHLATALYLEESLGRIAFLTADRRQRAAARAVGLGV